MKKPLIVTIITLQSLISYAQIAFEKGYFIDNTNKKIECLIKNSDWKNNPIEFTYKQSERTAEEKATIKEIKEFGIYNVSKYSRHTVKIDRSSENLRNMSTVYQPEFNEETVFLKVLTEGEANLYVYEEKGLVRYFIKKNNSSVEQLVYKAYKTADNSVRKNISYRQQLWVELKCPDITMNSVKSLAYKRDDLVKFFVKYYVCSNSTYVNYEEKGKHNFFNLSIRPGTNFSSLIILNTNNGRTLDFGNKVTIRLGLEAEFILPFNNNKWAVIIEPTYQYFKSSGEMIYLQTPTDTLTTNVLIDYKSIEVPFGLRYYAHLKNKEKLFFDATIVWDFPIANSSITGDRDDIIDLEIRSIPNLVFGLGYQIKNKYVIELRYGLSREVLNRYGPWGGNYKTFSIILGYKVLNNEN